MKSIIDEPIVVVKYNYFYIFSTFYNMIICNYFPF